MIREIELESKRDLEDYAALAHLSSAVADLRREADRFVRELAGRTVWMVSSTAEGGGVAEMLPRVVTLLRELGVATRWVVIGTEQPDFFPLTKRIHNLIHGAASAPLSAADRALYDRVSSDVADELRPRLGPHDLLVVHDPQPVGVGAKLVESLGILAIWRCHIGLDRSTPETEAAWSFLSPYLASYDHAVFTLPEYVPPFLHGASVITPGLDPLSHKNRDLTIHKLAGILSCSGLMAECEPMLVPGFQHKAVRLGADARAIDLVCRPIVCQISRWDRLKGFRQLLDGFARLKRELPMRTARHSDRERRVLELVRLVLAGPDPSSVVDDPEAGDVFRESCAAWHELEPQLREDVAIISLPMASRKHNALMVNALQRCSTIVAQCSLQEGFGLTVTEAMWKRIAVLGTTACGIRRQIRHGDEGALLDNPDDPLAVADALEVLLTQPRVRERLARTAQRRAHDEFLIFTQVGHWLRLLASRVRD